MAESHKKHLGVGIVLALSFLVVLGLIFSPIFPPDHNGKAQNGLLFADDLFNKLSKGSSYFIPKLTASNDKFMGKTFSVSIKMSKSDDKPGQSEERTQRSTQLFMINEGANVEVQGDVLKIEGDLGKVLAAALQDSEIMFRNEGETLKTKYGTAMKTDDIKQIYRQWHNVLSRIGKELTKAGKIEEANIVNDVTKKAIETAYNFYGVEAQKVSEKAVLMTGLLVFYVAYTLWWGFAIFYIFEGIGLSMKKAKVKKEV